MSHEICKSIGKPYQTADGKWIIPDVDMVTIDAFGGWTAATEKHFVDGGVFDQIYEEK